MPDNVLKVLLEHGIKELRPPQEAALKNKLLERNLIVASPTASGKTLIAEIAFLDMIFNHNKKCVYLVPLRSLAVEKYNDFKKKYGNVFDVAVSIGDMDSKNSFLKDCDIIIATSEKMDSLLRHGVPWLQEVGLLVVDEIHLLGEDKRGATLEVLLTRLRRALPNLKVLGLSATIKNCHEIGEWLNAGVVESEYRPVKLKEGVLLGDELDFFPSKVKISPRNAEPSFNIVHDTCGLGKQALIFVSSRRRAESLASKCRIKLSTGEVLKLKDLGKKVMNVLEKPTSQCEKLSRTVLNGVAFHHAGLLNEQRSLVEASFRNGVLKTIFATPTLALGVDLPAFRVVVRDLKRYNAEAGFSDWIKVLEYSQMAGRAGRPKYEKWGEAITIASSDDEKKHIFDNFITGEFEEVQSKLSHEPTLRMHLLALIAQNVINHEKDVLTFFSETLYAKQYGSLEDLQVTIRTVLDELESYAFITYDGSRVKTTPLGLRVAQLYLNPLSAHTLIKAMGNSSGALVEPISFLHAICMTLEMKPLLRLNQDDYSELAEGFDADRELLLFKEPLPESYDYENFIRAYKTSCLLEAWIGEVSEQNVLTKFKVVPGDLRAKLLKADWLLYSLKELAGVIGNKEVVSPVNNLRLRLRYGIRRELLPLVKFSGIGRVRARVLYTAGIKNTRDVKNASIQLLERLLGPRISAKLKAQVTGKKESVTISGREQSDLNNFLR